MIEAIAILLIVYVVGEVLVDYVQRRRDEKRQNLTRLLAPRQEIVFTDNKEASEAFLRHWSTKGPRHLRN